MEESNKLIAYSINRFMKNYKPSSRHNLSRILSSPKYRGKHVVVVEGKVFSAMTGQEAVRIFKQVVRKYPQKKPTITYIPKEDMLILTSFNYGSEVSF